MALHDESNGRIKISTSLVLQVGAWIIGVMVAYAAVTARLAVVESKQTETERRLLSIENKIDVLLTR